MEEAWRSEFAHLIHQDGPGSQEIWEEVKSLVGPFSFLILCAPGMLSPEGTRCFYQFLLISDIPTGSQLCPAPFLHR